MDFKQLDAAMDKPANSNGKKASEDEEETVPVSIASLRSKFENLAAGGGAASTSSSAKSERPKGIARISESRSMPGENLAADDESPSQAGEDNPQKSPVASRPTTPRLPESIPKSQEFVGTPETKPKIKPAPPVVAPKPVLSNLTSSAPIPSSSKLPATVSVPLSKPSSPRSGRRAAPSVPPKVVATSGSPAGSDAGNNDESLPSVKSLRDRFGGSSSMKTVSTPVPSSSNAATSPAPPPPQRRSRSPSTDTVKSNLDVEPPNLPRRGSAPVIKRTSTGGTVSIPMPSSPGSITAETDTGDAILSSSPSQMDNPPQPIPRIPSPKPPEPNRASKPVIRRSPSPVPPVVPRRNSSPLEVEEKGGVTPPDMLTTVPVPGPSAPPKLPVRKQTMPAVTEGPPPIPPNRPPPSAQQPTVAAANEIAPPRLPNRSRTNTVGQADAPVSSPPRLPARNPTLPVPAVPPGRASPIPTLLSSSPSRIREPASTENYTLPPPPMRVAPPQTNGASTLPPPQRAATIATPPRSKVTTNNDDSDEEDEEPENAGVPNLGFSAKRLLEDFPDSTHANRRPPKFVPDVKLSGTANIVSFAVYGRHVCVGLHNVQVYDTLMSGMPIVTVDLRETGLEHRVKEPKVTAMCFRPASCIADEGRYLWCGTKDGHLWELDIKTGKVTDTRSFAHASPVVHIFRHKHWLLSLEESGKLHVFEVGQLQDGKAVEDVSKIPKLCRTVRVADKFNFAGLVAGRLWTSTGPAHRSTTNMAAKGPTIRVYEPCSDVTMPPPKTLWTSEWTGAVTAATLMPFTQDKVFLAHEGGFVSIWDAEDLSCLQVLKISTTDILSLEGVGNRLWAGNRKGMIYVLDIEEKPWQVTNVWNAHGDHSVHKLMVDPWSVEQIGRFALWSHGRDGLRAWDGLRIVDWVDHQMRDRQPEYCQFRDIKVLVCTWNIDSAKPTDLTGHEINSKFMDELLNSVESPDVIVFGFQEVIPLTDKKLTAKAILFGSGKNRDAGAGDKISTAYRQWLDKLQSTVRMCLPDTPYVKVHSESLIGLFTCVFVKASERETLRDIEVCTVKRGIGNLYGNKGAIIARMVMDDTSICFINVHLAAGQSQKASRTADLGAIMEDKAIFPASDELPYVHGGDGTAILDHELVILNGDLNYRIDQRRENVVSCISTGDLACLLEHDQLRKEMKFNHAFRLRSLEEAPIEFAPTYKYNTGTQDYDTSEKRRIPAWCDRILYTKSERIKSLHYRRYETTVSDHKPVSAGFNVTLKAIDGAKMNLVRKEVTAEAFKKEAEVLGMMAVAYEKLL